MPKQKQFPRKLMVVLCSAAILCLLLASCGNTADSSGASAADASKTEDGLRIVTTIFPLYDWAREIVGDSGRNDSITWLTDNGVDIHSYQPTVEDIRAVSDCDLLIYIGGTSDEWITEALTEISDPKRHVICLLEELGDLVLPEEPAQGAQHEISSETAEPDEHIWLSPACAAVCCQRIAEELEEIDPENKDLYEANMADYLARLETLDAAYEEMTAHAKRHTVLFADRFPFLYLTNEYHLNYDAAFSGCSAEAGASFETIIFLAQQIDEWDLPIILKLKESTPDLAEAVRSASDRKEVQILSMDAMQAVTSSDAQNGITYLSVMEENLSVLRQALNE